MAYDGIVLRAISNELKEKLINGKIEKVYEPEQYELIFLVHTKNGNFKLYSSSNPNHARIHLINESLINPPEPLTFCMVLRKHLQGARIVDIKQIGSERILEIYFEMFNEMGYTVSKKLVFEIMGRHSNVILVDNEKGKVIDSIKHISFSESRVRQILPGVDYRYPPLQDKISFDDVDENTFFGITNGKDIMNKVSGISPTFSEEIASQINPYAYLKDVALRINLNDINPCIYLLDGKPIDYYPIPLKVLRNDFIEVEKESLSVVLEEFYKNKDSANQGKQKASDLIKQVNQILSKLYLKSKRLSEDLLKAENSEDLRLYGELLTANLSIIEPGMSKVKVLNYYTNEEIEIPLDNKISGSKNAQNYFKKYGKQKTAIHEKKIQLKETQDDITYLESVLNFLESTDDVLLIQSIKDELVETGYIRYRKKSGFKERKSKIEPIKYTLYNGMEVLVGRNNVENDYLTFKLSDKNDLWLHTKDIPGSHVLVKTNGIDITGIYKESEMDERACFEAAAISAYHSKGRKGENIPVDIVPIKYVKKPNGAKPGMVIFTNNRTVYVNPKIKEQD